MITNIRSGIISEVKDILRAISSDYTKAIYAFDPTAPAVEGDKMFIRRPGELAWGLKLQLMNRFKDLMSATGLDLDQIKMICDEAIAELER